MLERRMIETPKPGDLVSCPSGWTVTSRDVKPLGRIVGSVVAYLGSDGIDSLIFSPFIGLCWVGVSPCDLRIEQSFNG